MWNKMLNLDGDKWDQISHRYEATWKVNLITILTSSQMGILSH
jgi:hypothetical protein